MSTSELSALDLRGLNPAPVTPFTADGDVDHAAMAGLGKWLAGIDGVKSLVVLGHAGEGTFLTQDEQVALVRNLVNEVSVPIIAGITGEGTKVAVEEAKRAADAGATAGLVYPSHGWLRFGYQAGAPQDRYKAIYEETGLPLILFQYPDNTKANYNLDTQLEIAAQPGVFATKNGVRNMRRWDTEIPVLRRENPDLQILSCHDEYLLHTMFDVDGLLVGYGGLAPEPLLELIAAGKAQRLRTPPARSTTGCCRSPRPSTTAARTWRAPSPSRSACAPGASCPTPSCARRWSTSPPRPSRRSPTPSRAAGLAS